MYYGSELQAGPLIQAKPAGHGPAAGRAPVALDSSGGEPLPEPVRRSMERLFGRDLSEVRVHTGADAGALSARAFARGNHIHFAPGEYDPGTPAGRQLLGHEIAHVVQQRDGRVPAPGAGMIVTDPALEQAADEAGARAASGEPAPAGDVAALPAGTVPGDPPVQRMPKGKGGKNRGGKAKPRKKKKQGGNGTSKPSSQPGSHAAAVENKAENDAENEAENDVENDVENDDVESEDESQNAVDGEDPIDAATHPKPSKEVKRPVGAQVDADEEIPELVPANAEDAVAPQPQTPALPGREQRIETARRDAGERLTGPGLIPAGALLTTRPEHYLTQDMVLDAGALCPPWIPADSVAKLVDPVVAGLRGNAWGTQALIQKLMPWQVSPLIERLDADQDAAVLKRLGATMSPACLLACTAPHVLGKLVGCLPVERLAALQPDQVVAAANDLDVEQHADVLELLASKMTRPCLEVCIAPPVCSKLLRFLPAPWFQAFSDKQAQALVSALDASQDAELLERLAESLSTTCLQTCMPSVFPKLLRFVPPERCVEVLPVQAFPKVLSVMTLDQKAACTVSKKLGAACFQALSLDALIELLPHPELATCLTWLVPKVELDHVVPCVQRIPGVALKHLSGPQCKRLGPELAMFLGDHLRSAERILGFLPLETVVLMPPKVFWNLSSDLLESLPKGHQQYLTPLVRSAGKPGPSEWDQHHRALCEGLCAILWRYQHKLLDPQNLPDARKLHDIQHTSTLRPKAQELRWLVESVMAEGIKAVQIGSLRLDELIAALGRVGLDDLVAELTVAKEAGKGRGKSFGADGVEYSANLVEAVQHKSIGEEDIFSESERRNQRSRELKLVDPLCDALRAAFNQHAGLAASRSGNSEEHPLPCQGYRTIINLVFTRAYPPVTDEDWNWIAAVLYDELAAPQDGVVIHTVRFCWNGGTITTYRRQGDGTYQAG
jgi:hypothetical protein